MNERLRTVFNDDLNQLWLHYIKFNRSKTIVLNYFMKQCLPSDKVDVSFNEGLFIFELNPKVDEFNTIESAEEYNRILDERFTECITYLEDNNFKPIYHEGNKRLFKVKIESFVDALRKVLE